MAGTRLPTETEIARKVEQLLLERLPKGWALKARREVGVDRGQIDRVFVITSPARDRETIVIEIWRAIEPRQAAIAAERVMALAAATRGGATPVVAASYLAPRVREILVGSGVGYVDTTGNVHLEVVSPGLFISTPGSDRLPWPHESGIQSLRGRGTGRAMRAIIDRVPPFGVRELAVASGASAPTISRVLDFLEREAIVTRAPRGPVLAVDWEAAIRRWARDYGQTTTNTVTMFLEPRGLRAVEKKIAGSKLIYAASGAFAAQRFNPVAPARFATLYVEDVLQATEQLGLREVDSGANVLLLEPYDPVVFVDTVERDGLRCVAPSQLAVDLLTGPGREPSQGEEMLVWMKANEDVWRT